MMGCLPGPDDSVAVRLAEITVAAGEPVAAIYARGFGVKVKSDTSPVTDADFAAEHLILERLAQIFPGIPTVAEERVAARGIPTIGSRFLLVDPLDGTREFIAGRAEVTVNVALVEDGRPVAGAIYAPLLQQLWFGATTSHTLSIPPGADVGGLSGARRIKVRAPPAEGLVALVSRSHGDPETDAYLAGLPIAKRQPLGSSLKFCRIAEGLADIYPRLGETREWDTAAGHAILVAAGGEVTAPDGGPLRYGDVTGGFRRRGFVAVGGLRIQEGRAIPFRT
jgi:3'(2'),5'-bisphosphate nucleotidase